MCCAVAISLPWHMSLTEDVPAEEENLVPVEGRILGNSSASTVGAVGLGLGALGGWLYNKYQNRPSSSSSYLPPSSTVHRYPSSSYYYKPYNPTTTYYKYPQYTVYKPNPNTYYKPQPTQPPQQSNKPHKPYEVTCTGLHCPGQQPKPCYNPCGRPETNFCCDDVSESRKTSNYVAGALGALGGAWLYNKYTQYQQNQNYPYYYSQNTPSYHYPTTPTVYSHHNPHVVHYSNHGRPSVYRMPGSRSDDEDEVEVTPAVLPSYCEDFDCGPLGRSMVEPRKTSNYIAGALGALGGAYLYNKYTQYQQNQNYQTYPSYHHTQYYNSPHSYSYHPHQTVTYHNGRPVYSFVKMGNFGRVGTDQSFQNVNTARFRDDDDGDDYDDDNEEWWMW